MKKRVIKAVIFDVGNTLMKRKSYWAKKLWKKYNIQIEEEKYIDYFMEIYYSTKNISEAIEEFCQKCKIFNNNFIKELINGLNNDHKSFYVYADVLYVLKYLKKRGYKLGILSNWYMKGFKIISYHNLSSYFHYICISSKEGISKPNPDIFKLILKHLHVKPKEALMVGDRYDLDYLPAKKLGMNALLLERNIRKHKKSIHSLKQVITYIKTQ